jgi:hypothetical protein
MDSKPLGRSVDSEYKLVILNKEAAIQQILVFSVILS